MTRYPYIPPTMELLTVRFDNGLCVITTSNEPFQDNGDYNWGA